MTPVPERRLLLISYHFGPGCPTGGFRWNAMAGHLCHEGWEIDCITLARPGLIEAGDSDARGSDRLQVHSVPAPSWPRAALALPLALGRRSRRLFTRRRSGPSSPSTEPVDPESLFIWTPGHQRPLRTLVLHSMDYLVREATDMHWAIRARRTAAGLARSRRYCAVVVCSPPQITQVVGEWIGTKLEIPYVADYRDPWILGLGRHVSYYTGLERLIGKYHEKRSLRRASVVIHNTERARLAVANAIDFTAEHYAIPNGYDGTEKVDEPDSGCFRIVYTGHLHPFMDVRPVFRAAARLRRRHGLGPDNLRIEFVGTAPDFNRVPLASLADGYRLRDVFTMLGRIDRREVEQLQQAASILVAFDSTYLVVVPSKFYEYARMKGTMLLIGNREGAFNDAASRLGLRVFDPSEQDEIDASVEAAFARWRTGEFVEPMDPEGLFDRVHQSRRVAEILSRLAGDAAR